MNRYEIAYDRILDMEQEIIPELTDANGRPDYRSVNALSAAYLLQDYLAGKIAQNVFQNSGFPFPHSKSQDHRRSRWLAQAL